MEDAGASEDKVAERKARYGSLSISELEALAVSAIYEHRQLLASDQAVYDEWLRACDDPSNTGSVLHALRDEYLARQKKSEAQQEELSDILDALGFVPGVPFDDGGQESDEAPVFGNCNEMRN